jgi:hypothetical protein
MRMCAMPLSAPRNGSVGQTTGFAATIACVLLLVGCGGGGGGNNAGVPPPPAGDPQFRVSGTSPFAAGCNGAPAFGTLYINAEVEPMVALNPRDANNVVGVWQQDRWSSGGARGLLTGVSLDRGRTWTQHMAAFSRCTGESAANTGPFDLAVAPTSGGLFLGDYQALTSIGTVFLPFYAQTNTGDIANRTDVFSTLASSAGSASAARTDVAAGGVQALATPTLTLTPELRQMLHQSVMRTIQWRMPGRALPGAPRER